MRHWAFSHSVSIPSRRVGDWEKVKLGVDRLFRFHPLKAGRRLYFHRQFAQKTCPFPSPQGGSETPVCSERGGGGRVVSIPSRRVGDRICHSSSAVCSRVSIPSRRVGDLPVRTWRVETYRDGFHPLKAGRRRSIVATNPFALSGFHPLKAGRRLSELHKRWTHREARFHPLKAGRRRG